MYSLYDWPRFFEDYSIEYDPINSRNFISISCPWCQENKKHGGVHVEKNYFSCWKCGKHSAHELTYKLTGLSWNSISRQYKLNPDQHDMILNRINKEKIHAEKIEFPIGTVELQDHHKSYLKNRGFDPDYLVRKYKIKATNAAGIIKNKNIFPYRIIIPIYYKNRIISIQGRDWTNQSPNRYMTYPEDLEIVHHKDILYNLDSIQGDHIILCEGIFDVWKLGDNSVCCFGTGYTNIQVNLLSEFKKISILFDSEPEAQKKAEELCRKLKGLMVKTEIIILPEGDPGSLSVEEARNLVKEIIG